MALACPSCEPCLIDASVTDEDRSVLRELAVRLRRDWDLTIVQLKAFLTQLSEEEARDAA
jgi:hypothetical protein